MTGDYIPAGTPVVLRAEDSEIQLRPINKPEHPAVESNELGSEIDELLEVIQGKINGLIQGAPRLRTISEVTSESPLVGSFFGEEIEDADANTYLPLAIKTKREEDGSIGLDMEGLGFWKDGISKLEGNKAYMNGAGQKDFMKDATFADATAGEEGEAGIAPGYIFKYPDGDNTYTAIENVNTTKEVKSVRYYNTLGIESTTPFQGVNIIVTTFTDGTHATTKVIK